MPIIKCKMCGGDIDLAADKTFGTCEYCGSTMTLPKVSDEQKAAAFNRGNHFRRIGEFDKALAVYERIVAEDDTDAEAHWCCALCRFGIEYVEDPATYEWMPTCHRASFDSFLEDVDYLAAIENSDGITRRQYQKDAAKIAEVQRGILATSQNTEPYDVFISYKELDENGSRTRDSILAQEIYYRLTEKGWRVFFSRISLEDVPGTQYEPYIFAALNSAKVMIVVGTSAENLNAVWVKNEWSRFLSMMRKDRSKLLIPCYRDMDPYDLPEQLAVLMSYDMGKIGFVQDLIRGVDKVLTAEKKEPVKETVKETVVVQQPGGGPNVTALLKRGQQALEDSEWDKARESYDQVLNMDAENAEAFLGLFLAGEKCEEENAYIERACTKKGATETLNVPSAADRINENAAKYKLDHYLFDGDIRKLFDYDLQYPTTLRTQKLVAEQEKASFQNDRNLNRAFRYAKGDVAARLNAFKTQLFAGLDRNVTQAEEQEEAAREEKKAAYEVFLDNAENLAQEKNEQAQARKEEDYQALCRRISEAKTIKEFDVAKYKLFPYFNDYKDSAEQYKRIEEGIARLEKEAAEEAEAERLRKEVEAKAVAEEAERQEEQKRIAAEKADKKRKKTIATNTLIIVACIVFVTVLKFVIIPNQRLNKSVAMIDAGDYKAAYLLLDGMDYKNSKELQESIKLQYEKECISEAQVRSYVPFGSYEQDNDSENGKEDIEWLVLAKKDDRILVISRYALDCQRFNTSATSVTWETCSVRKWLNETFLNNAFSEEERAMIPNMIVTADNNPDYSISPGKSTTDQMFLFSIREANNYFNTNNARQCQGTPYCFAQGAYKDNSGNCWWWLRTPGFDTEHAAIVRSDGSIYSTSDINGDGSLYSSGYGVTLKDVAVRPAMWIDLTT